MLPGNKVFYEICQNMLLWPNTIHFNCVFLFPSKSSPPLPSDLSVFRESTPRGRADLSAQMEAPPLTPPPTALSDR